METTTATAPADIASVHRLAVERHASLAATRTEAERERDRLTDARLDLIATLAAGTGTGTESDLRAADAAIAEAARRVEIARAIAAAGRTAAEVAEIPILAAEARALDAKVLATFRAAHAAARAADAALAEVNLRIADLKTAVDAVNAMQPTRYVFGERIADRARYNSVLAATPMNERPMTRVHVPNAPRLETLMASIHPRGGDPIGKPLALLVSSIPNPPAA